MSLNPAYRLRDPENIASPALLFYSDLIQNNIARSIEIAGSPSRLRPHVKTHKTREIVRMQLKAGITKHKCATIAEAELLATAGAPDILIAYPLVGPNVARLVRLVEKYPESRFAVTVDDRTAAERVAAALNSVGRDVDFLLDLDVGQHRTGIAAGEAAAELYRHLANLPGLKPGGFQLYDGHNHHESLEDRTAAVARDLAPALRMREELIRGGVSVPRLVLGGTPTFPVHAKLDLPGVECSPGTFVLHDHGYGSKFRDMSGFIPAALMLTRVVSRPTADRVTLDLGTKAVASDPPAGKRVLLLDFPEYEAVGHNEEHFIVRTAEAGRFKPGDVVYAMPAHICPTCALHREALVVRDGEVEERWAIVGRDRVLSV
jgi:D-serine deaminase-like pyridoxal phosphate-dependent protein